MKKIISNFSSKLLSREDLKSIKGGLESLEGCGQCMNNAGTILSCNGTVATGCCCSSGNDANLCG